MNGFSRQCHALVDDFTSDTDVIHRVKHRFEFLGGKAAEMAGVRLQTSMSSSSFAKAVNEASLKTSWASSRGTPWSTSSIITFSAITRPFCE